ncbi:acetoacetate decarboxylase family protein [Oceanobacillus sojae]|uniref:acetoacetate decarboxylase family protein n=1 Tax=Oceanobacillus sojae TaxID=582851 RepID=UPI00098862DA|nr:acetoacetate decarboxylase family protein [Oceanobacillus sojae]
MKRPFEVWNADNMPVQAPFFKSPSIPYFCKDLSSINIYCRTSPEIIKKYLEPTPFEYVSNNFIVNFGDYANGTSATYHDLGIIVPVKYKDLIGGYYLFEYEDLASSVSAGRELWGYPKKTADFKKEEKDGKTSVSVFREDAEIVHFEVDLNKKPRQELPVVPQYPHILLYTMPRHDGPGILTQKVLSRDSSPDFVTKKKVEGYADIKLSGYENFPIIEPLDELNPVEVYGASYTIGDYAATHENGWAKVVDVIIPDKDLK